MWDPTVYRRFGTERSRPFFDLVRQIGAERPRAVVDLGCGPGELTRTLAERWPGARVVGIDSSPEMIAKAAADPGPVGFRLGGIEDWHPEPDVDVVVTNAALQWVPGHREMLARWVTELPSGAWLAVQVPGNFDSPGHRAVRELGASARYAERLDGLLRDDPVDDAAGYAALLTATGATVDAWETTYLHLLPAAAPGADHPVLSWMEGTALRPVRAALDEADWADFRAELAIRIAETHPERHGVVAFPFRRIFVVASI
ncbi:trans-aconitate 2-methyltransferase [Actinoplanes aureus]|uniref:Trans-aconitate 2-methyltransferase n=1 Tax=Actinoplanes aureus TaxID=2792083 RepID=A0A931G7J0_9ACTN|nr:trans-aconitate 2-methyltransferase [Actinoplanes aureus]MBG0568304.1 trans-aconitate 2-methyltransferase [Actinoplanes aureus]